MKLSIKILTFFWLLFPASGWCLGLQYDLAVHIDPVHREVAGTAWITSARPIEFVLSVTGLQDIRVNGRPASPGGREKVTLSLGENDRVRIDYRLFVETVDQGFMDARHVFLTGRWYPRPAAPVRYTLAVTLPEEFTAVSEAETVSIKKRAGRKTFRFQFPHPLQNLHIAASTRYTVKKTKSDGITIEAYFFKEDAALADTYIAYAQKYLTLYAGMLTPYPYKRFAIVENILPTGYAMPTFTLLGKDVVKLPFIVRTSLGHEILHQWFGSTVYIDYAHGNWAEGLVTYLADHHYAENDNRGRAYRKQILINHQAYINPDNAMPVNRFRSRHNRAEAAIGYGRTAMIFHMLHRRFKDDLFFESLRVFIRKKQFRAAGWDDIRQAFEKTTGEPLKDFFSQWVGRTDIPDMAVEDAIVKVENGRPVLKFSLLQRGTPFRLSVPVTIKTGLSQKTEIVTVEKSPAEISIPLDTPPARVVVDGEYAMLRTLSETERPPVLADIMGSGSLLVAAADSQRAAYTPLVEALGIKKTTWVDPDMVTVANVSSETVFIAGFDNPLAARLLGGPVPPDDGLRLNVYKNPYAPAKRLLLVQAPNTDAAAAAARKISHYGKYTTLAFEDGRNTHKAIGAAENGLPVLSRPKPVVLRPAKIETLADIFAELRQNRIIFVGEQHDRFAHHLNQLQVIQALQAAGETFSVGMEMFQKPFQPVIDAYLAGKIDERTFLARSMYFDRWRYDYHLYKPIVDFLKANKIPLVALNIPGDISRKTGREGLDSLSVRQKKQIPARLNFSDEAYREDLRQIFDLHGNETGLAEFNYFYQAQTLWDEAMASAAAKFLTANPGHKLVVLAGNGHVRFKYGIPRRLYRRTHQPYAVVVQDEEIETGIADYVLFTTDIEGDKAPKLGVGVEEKEGSLVVKSVIKHAPAGKAGFLSGDIFVTLNGYRIETLADLKLALFYTKLGDRIRLKVKREGAVLEKEVELKAHPRHIPMMKK